MAKYVYPAIFVEEKEGYSIFFPDFENCATMGDNIADGMEMAEDALALTLWRMEKEGLMIPNATPIQKVEYDNNAFVTLIRCDTLEYRKKFSKKAVKKTLTIPEWLNEEAMAVGLNFSQILQDALMKTLHLQ